MLENCRLCQTERGTLEIACNGELIDKIYKCSGIRMDDEQAEKLPRFVCSECNKTISFIYDYLEKVKQNEATLRATFLSGDNKKFKCPECRKTYVKYGNFQMHKKSHATLFCFTCDFVFDDQSEKQGHSCQNSANSEVAESEYNLLVKNDCTEAESGSSDKIASQPQDGIFKSQSAEQNERLKEGFVCKICQEMFVLRVDFWLHKKAHKTTFACKWENCSKICSSPYALKTHEMKHEGKKRFLCVTCGKAFLTKNSLNCHEKIHLDVKGYVCKLCNIGFSVRSNLRAHEKKHHEGVRFYCSQCTRAFITKCSLDRHERIHTGVKEFQCQKCPSAFYTSKELQKHQRYHQGLRQHKCEQCFKTFFEKHHLTVHLRSHTGERPYVCKIAGCNKSFAESQKLTRHFRAKHTT